MIMVLNGRSRLLIVEVGVYKNKYKNIKWNKLNVGV